MGRISDGGENGTDSPATAVNTSGRSIAEFQAIGAPQSWPTIDGRALSERADEGDVVGDVVAPCGSPRPASGFDERP